MAELLFIGTGSGKTSLHRFHSSFIIFTKNYNLLIDAGDGISKALLSQGIDYNLIDGILLTHLHPDHYSGLVALLVQMKMLEREKSLDVFINSDLVKIVQQFVLQSYLFPERIGFVINYHPQQDNFLFKVNDDINFLSRQNSHLKKVSHLEGYKSQCFSSSSLWFNIEGKNIHYTSDIGSKDDIKLFSEQTPDILISETTHINNEDIINSYENDELPKRIILTHLTDEEMNSIQSFISSLPNKISEKITIAFDGYQIEL